MKSRRIRRKLDALVTSGAGASGTKEVEDQCGTRYRPRQLKGEPRRAERIMLGLTDVGPPCLVGYTGYSTTTANGGYSEFGNLATLEGRQDSVGLRYCCTNGVRAAPAKAGCRPRGIRHGDSRMPVSSGAQ